MKLLSQIKDINNADLAKHDKSRNHQWSEKLNKNRNHSSILVYFSIGATVWSYKTDSVKQILNFFI